MTAYRRLRLSGGTYFFTLCLQQRGSRMLTERIVDLRAAWGVTFRELPATVHAVTILPDHLHAVLTEPEGEVRFSERWRRLKARFTHAVPERPDPTPSLRRKREAGIWQRRFWEHALRDEREVLGAIDYCRVNAVRHGLVTAPEDWPFVYVRP